MDRSTTGTIVAFDCHSLFWKSATAVKGRISRISLSTSTFWNFKGKACILQRCQWTAFQSTKSCLLRIKIPVFNDILKLAFVMS